DHLLARRETGSRDVIACLGGHRPSRTWAAPTPARRSHRDGAGLGHIRLHRDRGAPMAARQCRPCPDQHRTLPERTGLSGRSAEQPRRLMGVHLPNVLAPGRTPRPVAGDAPRERPARSAPPGAPAPGGAARPLSAPGGPRAAHTRRDPVRARRGRRRACVAPAGQSRRPRPRPPPPSPPRAAPAQPTPAGSPHALGAAAAERALRRQASPVVAGRIAGRDSGYLEYERRSAEGPAGRAVTISSRYVDLSD